MSITLPSSGGRRVSHSRLIPASGADARNQHPPPRGPDGWSWRRPSSPRNGVFVMSSGCDPSALITHRSGFACWVRTRSNTIWRPSGESRPHELREPTTPSHLIGVRRPRSCAVTAAAATTVLGMASPTDQEAFAGAARLLRSLLAEVEDRRLSAPRGRDVALVRRIEGAATALEAAAEHDPQNADPHQ